MNPEHDYGLVFDVECSGSNPHVHELLAVGVCVTDETTGEVVYNEHYTVGEDRTKDRCEEERCLKEFWLRVDKDGNQPLAAYYKELRKRMERYPKNAQDSVADMIHQLQSLLAACPNVHDRSDTALFDFLWIQQFYVQGSLDYVFGDGYNPPRCTTDFYKGVVAMGSAMGVDMGDTKGLSNYEKACRALGVEPRKYDVEHDHDPKNDAKVIALNWIHIQQALAERKKKSMEIN